MKLIIAGSRDIDERIAFWEALQYLQPAGGEFNLSLRYDSKLITELITGHCRGVDKVPYMLNQWWGMSGYSLNCDIKAFPADWTTHGKAAGPIRNKQMAEYADAALVIMKKGGSAGSKNMIDCMRKLNKSYYVVEI